MAFIDTIQSGRFTSLGTETTLILRADVDWLNIYNYTQMAAVNNGYGFQYRWQRGMSDNDGLVYYHPAGDHTMAIDTCSNASVNGFTLVDTSGSPLGSLNTSITAVSTAAIPIVSASSTTGLANSDIVRLINITGAQQLGGIDFTIDTLVTNTSFRLPYMAQLGGAGTTGSFRLIKWDKLYYPRYRYISKVTKASSAVVTLTVTHGYSVGQVVRFKVPSAYGMVELDNLSGKITAVDTTNNTVTVDIDSTSFTTFAFPATTAVPFSPAIMVPVGETPATPPLLTDAFENTGEIGIILAAGTKSPAGNNGDVIFWQAGKSFSNLLE